MKTFLISFPLALTLASAAFASNDGFVDLCDSKMTNVISIFRAKKEKALTPYTDQFQSDVAVPSVASMGIRDNLTKLFKSYKVSDVELVGGSKNTYQAYFEFASERLDIGIISNETAGNALHVAVARQQKGLTTLEALPQNALGEGYVYTQKTRDKTVVIRVESDRILGERSIFVSLNQKTFKIKLREKIQSDKQILDFNRKMSSAFQKTMTQYASLFDFTVLDESGQPSASTSFKLSVEGGTVLRLILKSAFVDRNLFDLSVNGFDFPKSLKEEIKSSALNNETRFEVTKIEGLAARGVFEVKIKDLPLGRQKLMTLSQIHLNALKGQRSVETTQVLLTPKSRPEDRQEAFQFYSGAEASGRQLIALLRKLSERYSFGDTQKNNEPYRTLQLKLDVTDDSIWAFVSDLGLPRWNPPEWQQKIRLIEKGGEVNLEQDGDNFVYRSKTPVLRGFLSYEIATELDVSTRKKYLTFTVGGGGGESPTVFRTQLTLKKFSAENRRAQSVKANKSFRNEFLKLQAAYEFLPLDSHGNPDPGLTFETTKNGDSLHLELVGNAGVTTLFSEDIYRDSSDFGVILNTHFFLNQNSFQYTSSTKLGTSDFHKFIEVTDQKGTKNKLMKLTVKIPSPISGVIRPIVYYVGLVPRVSN